MVCLTCIFGGNGIAMEIIKSIQFRIYEIRGERVMLDFDLADLYETETKILNQAVKETFSGSPGFYVSIDRRLTPGYSIRQSTLFKVTDCDLKSR